VSNKFNVFYLNNFKGLGSLLLKQKGPTCTNLIIFSKDIQNDLVKIFFKDKFFP
jgi:hypothetical protein